MSSVLTTFTACRPTSCSSGTPSVACYQIACLLQLVCNGEVICTPRWETGYLGSSVWQKLRCLDFPRMVCADLMHCIAGENRRVFQMVLGMRANRKIARFEAELGRYVSFLYVVPFACITEQSVFSIRANWISLHCFASLISNINAGSNTCYVLSTKHVHCNLASPAGMDCPMMQ